MTRRTVNIYEAKTQLSRLVDQAAAGEEIIISRSGRPLVRLASLGGESREVRFGLLKGAISVADDFDAPLSGEVLESFES